MLLDFVDRHSDSAVALIDDVERLSYGELRDQARRVAAKMHGEFGSGQFFIIRARPSARFVVSLLGSLYSGNTPIPVAPDLPERDVNYVRGKCNAAAIFEPFEREAIVGFPSLDCRDDSRPAMIILTSGTTGYPKGVIISHANLLHSCDAISEYLDYHQYHSAAVVLPLHYSYALLSQVCCQFYVGGLTRLFGNLRNPIKFNREVTQLELRTFCGVPSTYHALTEFHRLSGLHMPTVRVLCSAGAAMNSSRFKQIKQIFPNATFFNNYGMTEAAPRISYIREDDPWFYRPTCGRPMRGVEVCVVDPTTHAPVPDGEKGVLVIRGPNITSGYLNDPDRTAEAFTGDGYLISNDLAYMENGYIFICGRTDDVFNVAGEKVAPLEIERVLNELEPIAESAVTGIPDDQRGMVPVAFVKLSRPTTRYELVSQINGQLPMQKIPQRFFEVRGFPLSANGKLRRKELRTDDPNTVIREIV
jgi:acyl-CoA synthetase (AMP-forming)/AMP-acid ligase II